jgi:hypothetical protein
MAEENVTESAFTSRAVAKTAFEREDHTTPPRGKFTANTMKVFVFACAASLGFMAISEPAFAGARRGPCAGLSGSSRSQCLKNTRRAARKPRKAEATQTRAERQPRARTQRNTAKPRKDDAAPARAERRPRADSRRNANVRGTPCERLSGTSRTRCVENKANRAARKAQQTEARRARLDQRTRATAQRNTTAQGKPAEIDSGMVQPAATARAQPEQRVSANSQESAVATGKPCGGLSGKSRTRCLEKEAAKAAREARKANAELARLNKRMKKACDAMDTSNQLARAVSRAGSITANAPLKWGGKVWTSTTSVMSYLTKTKRGCAEARNAVNAAR